MWRKTPEGTEVLLIHRPKYDDWSFPKGKADRGEDDLTCALREVQEETGLTCEPTQALGTSEYTTRRGRAKSVRYWAMRPVTGKFEPNSEVDAVRWVPVHEVADQLTYEHEATILTGLDHADPASEAR